MSEETYPGSGLIAFVTAIRACNAGLDAEQIESCAATAEADYMRHGDVYRALDRGRLNIAGGVAMQIIEHCKSKVSN